MSCANSKSRIAPRVLLVEMPFKTVYRPSIGLSLLRAAAKDRGFDCEIRYANLEFAERIGTDLYNLIAEQLPVELLLGDLVFAHLLGAPLPDPIGLRGLSARSDQIPGRRLGEVPDWLWDAINDIRNEATSFLEATVASILTDDFDVLGLSCMFQITPSLALARLVRQTRPTGRPAIVVGGSHCEGSMGLVLHRHFPWIDFVCRGEGEALLPELAERVTSKSTDFTDIPGLIWRSNTESVCNGERPTLVVNMDSLPRPEYSDWLDQAKTISSIDMMEKASLPLETSRGCWFGAKIHCVFCGLNGDTMAFRSKSSTRVMEEVRDLQAYGIPRVYAVDLILDHRYFADLLPALAHFDHGMSFFYEIKSNLEFHHVLALKEAGIDHIQPGIESLSTGVLRTMRKGVRAYQNVRLLKWCAQLGIGTEWNILYGFPGESPMDYEALAELIPALTHLRPPSVGCYRVRLDRFSPLFDAHSEYGIVDVRPADAYSYAFPLPREVIEDLAYHFEYRLATAIDPEEYIAPVRHAVRNWHSAVGSAAFVSVLSRDGMILHDTRECASQRAAVLQTPEMNVLLACEGAATLQDVAARCGVSLCVAKEILDSMMAKRWVVNVDDRYVNLAVAMDSYVPEGTLSSIAGFVAAAVYKQRMRDIWEWSDQYNRLPARAAGVFKSHSAVQRSHA